MAGLKISQLSSSLAPNLTGVVPVVLENTTYKSTLQSLRQVLVDSGSHVFTGSQVINGDLTISGSITAQQYILSSSITNITTETISGSSNFGNSPDDTHRFTGSLSVSGSIRANNILDYGNLFVSGTVVIGELMPLTGSDLPKVHIKNSGSINIVHFEANNQYYAQINVTNTNSGSNASSDVVITADNGNEGIHFVDLGINSSTYSGGLVGYENDAYLLNVGKDLYIGTVGGTNHPAKLKLFAENSWENPQITIHTGSQVTFNTLSFTDGYSYEFSGSVKLQDELNVDGSVTASYFVGDGSQLTNLPNGLNGDVDRLVNGNLEVILDNNGTINTPLLLPKSFTINLTEEFYMGGNSEFALTGTPWTLDVSYVVSMDGNVETQVNNIFPIIENPGYASGDTFDFGYSVHGISGYTLSVTLNDVYLPGGAGWTSNLAFNPPPEFPATIKSLGAIKLTANNKDLVLGTNGSLTVPGTLNIDNTIYNSTGDINITTEGDNVNILGSNLYIPNGGITTNYDIITEADLYVNGVLNIKGVSEDFVLDGEFNGDRDFDFNSGSIFYLGALGGNGVWNINNVPTTDNRAITMTFVIEQGSTAYSGSAYQINGETVAIKWADSTIPTGSANKTEIIGLTAFRTYSSWNVLGSLSTFGS